MSADVELVPNNTLNTPTPEEGRQLAIAMARRVIRATQPDQGAREKMREEYARDAGDLIAIAQVVAVEFATIAAANDYWR